MSNQGNFMTRSRPFQKIVDKTFDVCDANKTGEIKKEELYAGLLLVHLKLAKFAGPAACFPPTRATCDSLFDAADHDKSGGIDKKEFVKIMGICCAQILSRMLAYYLVLVLCVPILAAKVVDIGSIPEGSYYEMAAEQVISMSMFYIAIPLLWDAIDEYSEKGLQEKPPKKAKEEEETTTTTTTTGEEGEAATAAETETAAETPELATEGEEEEATEGNKKDN